MIVNPAVRVLVVAAFVAALASPALAQNSAPYRGLFRGSGSTSTVGQQLDFNLSLVEAYDDDVYADVRPGGITPGDDPTAGLYTMLVTSTDYRFARRGLEVGVSGTSALRYYPDPRQVRSISHSGSAGLSARVSRTATLFVNQSVAYSPSYMYGLFPSTSESLAPGDLIPAAPDYSLDQADSFSYRTTATLTHRMGDAGSLSSTGEFHYTDYLHEDDDLQRRDMATTTIRGQYAHRLARNTHFSSGYSYQSGDSGYVSGTATTEHQIQVGTTYSRALSVSRRADIGFSIGLSVIDIPIFQTASTGTASNGRLYRMSGNLRLGYEFRPGWQARVAYRRGLEYVPDLTAPVFLDGVTTELGGLITRRFGVSASAAYSKGASALNAIDSPFDTYASSVSGRYAFTSGLAVFAEYLYYFYDFRESALLAPGLPPGLQRNAVRAGLMLWVPAVGR